MASRHLATLIKNTLNMNWSKYTKLFYSEKASAYLLYSTLSNALIKVDPELYDELTSIMESPSSINPNDERYKFLFDGRFIVESDEAEINKIILQNLRRRFSTDSLSLTIAPTRYCNFACPYCYEKGRIMHKEMSKEVMDGIVSYVKNNYRDMPVSVIWYGGEPTEAIDSIVYLTTHLKPICKYSASIITNGYNLDKLLPIIDELKITSAQITIDGARQSHNKTRILRSGQNSYDKIMDNINATIQKKDDMNIYVRMNITKQNSNEYVGLYKEIQSRFGSRVILYPAFVHNYNNSCSNNTCYECAEEKSSFLTDLYELHGIYTNELLISRKNKGCGVQSQNSFVIGPEGELYKCWHHIGMQDKVIGNILAPNIITNINRYATYVLENDNLFDKNCHECVLFPSCTGGCVDLKNLKEDYCMVAKSNLEKFIELQFMQNSQN